MNLYLLRHAEAEELGGKGPKTDRERRLTRAGEKRARKVGRAIRKLGIRPKAMLSSPFPRAWQTAELAARELKFRGKLLPRKELEPGCDAARLVAALRKSRLTRTEVLVVGHEPDFSTIVSQLTTGSTGLRMKFRKAGLCLLTIPRLAAGACAELEWLLAPDQLERFAKS